jgi:hypothetical protein
VGTAAAVTARDTPVEPAEAQTCPQCGQKVLDRRSWNGDGEWAPALYHERCGRAMRADRAALVFKRYLDKHHLLPRGMGGTGCDEPGPLRRYRRRVPDARCPACRRWSPRQSWDAVPAGSFPFPILCPACGAVADVGAIGFRMTTTPPAPPPPPGVRV